MSSSQEVEAAMTKEPSTEQQIVSCGKAGLRVVAAVVPAAVTGALALLRAGRPRSLSACLLACAFILLRLIMRLFSSDSFVYFSFCVCVSGCLCACLCVSNSLCCICFSVFSPSPSSYLRVCSLSASLPLAIWGVGRLLD